MLPSSQLNMRDLPPIFILPTHLPTEDLHEAEDALYHAGGRLSYQASEARIFLTKVVHTKRAAFDLRGRGLWTQEETSSPSAPDLQRRKLVRNQIDGARSDPETASEDDSVPSTRKRKRSDTLNGSVFPDLSTHVVVLKLEWLEACIKHDTILPLTSYIVYFGKIVDNPVNEKPSAPMSDGTPYIRAIPEPPVETSASTQPQGATTESTSILGRAKAEATADSSQSQKSPFHRRKFGQQSRAQPSQHSLNTPKLHRATTSELDGTDLSQLPPVPSWLLEPQPRPMYSCLRDTPPLEQSPNRHFINQLTKIKEARLLTLDEIGVRAYSTSIASLAAYPHRITSPLEITRLPGCSEKIAQLWLEWHESVTLSDHPSLASETDPDTESVVSNNDPNSTNKHLDADAALDAKRTIPAVNDLAADKSLLHIQHFHQIWGVGPDTARKFHLNHGWNTLDDVVEFGWHTLTRSQQIGVKFFDEFQQSIPRAEVESIARTILHHARLSRSIDRKHWTNDVVTDDQTHNNTSSSTTTTTKSDPRDFVAIIVGGYRRGKSHSGDVDVILSHRDPRMTQDLVVDVVTSLESASYITHTLTLHTTTSDRDQQTLPHRGDGHGHGHGFDSLDKAFVAWQDPNHDTTEPPQSKVKKSPNVHRRVDIIVSSWRTVGCAVLGWSGGTTFQRDIRRWVKREKGWKFDSSGVRDRGSGVVLDLEAPRHGDEADTWLDRERRVMEAMGIGWRDPGVRCTG